MMIEDPIEEWPVVDCLITFYSLGFPMDKAEQYIKLRNPFLINDLASQSLLWDRRNIYYVCERHGIPVPKHIIVNRGDLDGLPDDELDEGDDWVEVKGKGRISKPFVEKPVDADDHQVRIYYPRASGGGCKELFRKVGDRSSEFYPDRDHVRRDGSYIYEEFLPTEGTDVKVYAVTGDYAHAEARKSPVMDGRVVRDDGGVEVRYPIILSTVEKDLCRRVVNAFRQRVCGFDMLRSGGKAYVCDINGWSFVKRSTRYHKDAAVMMARLMRSACGRPEPQSALTLDDLDDAATEASPSAFLAPKRRHEELRAVVAVIRHGDRTPKQKLKLKVAHEGLLAMLPKGCKVNDETKFKTAQDLGKVLQLINDMIVALPPRVSTPALVDGPDEDVEEEGDYLDQARAVLEMHGSFKGINRKVQLKCTRVGDDGAPCEAQLVIKWGGVLTTAGREHAEQMGRSFRERLYPGTDGLLRLHSTYRHDLKIYSSDEGRVQVTAAAFAKGLLDLEGHLTPILVSLIRKGGDVNKLLDDTTRASKQLEQAKHSVRQLLAGEAHAMDGAPLSVVAAKKELGDATAAMARLHTHIKGLANQLRAVVRQLRTISRPERFSVAAAVPTGTVRMNRQALSNEPVQLDVFAEKEGGSAAASLGETAELDRGDGAKSKSDAVQLAFARWDKLSKDFYKAKTQSYDPSKIPDIFDCVKFDLFHNPELYALKHQYLFQIYPLAKRLADIVVPQEYGHDQKSKLELGALACNELLKKICEDFVVASQGDDDDADAEGSDVAPGGHSRRISEVSSASASRDGGIVSPKHSMSPWGSMHRVFEEPVSASGGELAATLTLPAKAAVKDDTQHRLDKKHAKQVGIKSSDRHVRTRLYFTSESHLHALLNVLRFAHVTDHTIPSPSRSTLLKLEEVDELGYLSNIVFRLFEVVNESGEKRFSLRVAFSPGVPLNVHIDADGKLLKPVTVGAAAAGDNPNTARLANQLPPASPFIALWSDLDLDQALEVMSFVVNAANTPRSAEVAAAASSGGAHPLQRSFSTTYDGHGVERPFSRMDAVPPA